MSITGTLDLDLTDLGPPVRALRGRFVWSVRAWSWGLAPPDALAVDGTLELTVALDTPGGGAVRAYDHACLQRTADDPHWIQPLLDAHAEDLVGLVFHSDHGWAPAHDARVHGTIWYGASVDPYAPTRAARWAGAARDEVSAALGLASWNGMQDWPLEVAEASRLADAMAYYDRATRDAVRFDAMALALACFDEAARAALDTREAEAWFDRVVVRDIARLGQLVADWALLDVLDADGQLEPAPDPDACFAITPHARRWWRAARVPAALR